MLTKDRKIRQAGVIFMQKAEKIQDLREFAAEIRVETLKTIGSLGFGHVGGSMSIADAMAVLYGGIMRIDPKNPRWEGRDWCVLSKGHAGPCAYATLALKGFYDLELTRTLNRPNTNFPSHTDRTKTPGVDLTTGSLGQGISSAAGAALGHKLSGRDNRVFVFIGDGEADEGQVWEAAQFAAHYKLDNLICLVDDNKNQLDGPVDEIMSHGKGLGAKFDAFGWRVIELADGNDVEAVYDALQEACIVKGQPTAIILNTVKGKGAVFAEGTGAHSSQPSAEQWEEAIAAAEAELAAIRAAKRGAGE